MGEPFPGDTLGRSYAEVIASKLAILAAEGDISAVRELADRTEGKATQRIESVGLEDAFTRMSSEELLRYAETGETPAWLQFAERSGDGTN